MKGDNPIADDCQDQHTAYDPAPETTPQQNDQARCKEHFRKTYDVAMILRVPIGNRGSKYDVRERPEWRMSVMNMKRQIGCNVNKRCK